MCIRDRDKPTDVLSFSLVEGEGPNHDIKELGDIVISIDAVKRQALEYEVSEKYEIIRLLTHGFLHLSGYDHENVSEEVAKKMFNKQDELIELVNKNLN